MRKPDWQSDDGRLCARCERAPEPSRYARTVAMHLFEAGLLKSGCASRAATIIDQTTVDCDVCGKPCCGACSWNYGTKRNECQRCDNTTEGSAANETV